MKLLVMQAALFAIHPAHYKEDGIREVMAR